MKNEQEEKTENWKGIKPLAMKKWLEFRFKFRSSKVFQIKMHTRRSQLFCLGLDFDIQRLFLLSLRVLKAIVEWKKTQSPKKPEETF